MTTSSTLQAVSQASTGTKRAFTTAHLRHLTTGSMSALALSLALAPAAQAQQTVPGESDNCEIVNGIAICEGDLEDGVQSDVDDPVFDQLIVRNPGADIAPPDGFAGIGVARNAGDINVTVEDTVTILTSNAAEAQGRGVLLNTGDGAITVDSAANITTNGNGGSAIGIQARGSGGGNAISITNSGTITTETTNVISNGIVAEQRATGGDISLVNTADGVISATSLSVGERDDTLAGLFALNDFGGDASIDVVNDGRIRIEATTDNVDTNFEGIASAIVTNLFNSTGITSVTTGANSVIETEGTQTIGIIAVTSAASATTGGVIQVQSGGTMDIAGENSWGVATETLGPRGLTSVSNEATIQTSVGTGVGVIHFANAADDTYVLTNSANISGGGTFDWGLLVQGFVNNPDASNDVLISNTGDITLATDGRGISVELTDRGAADVSITNSGTIDLSNAVNSNSQGIRGTIGTANNAVRSLSITQDGTVTTGNAVGVLAIARDSFIRNTGTINAGRSGVVVIGGDGGHTIQNIGTISGGAEGTFSGVVVDVESNTANASRVEVLNAETASISGASGIFVGDTNSTRLRVFNSGSIAGLSADGSQSGINATNGELSLENVGTITAASGVAVRGGAVADDLIVNEGTITGDVLTSGGADTFLARIGSNVDGAINLGEGDDSLGLAFDAGQNLPFTSADLGTGDDEVSVSSTDFGGLVIEGGEGFDRFRFSAPDAESLSFDLRLAPFGITGFETYEIATDTFVRVLGNASRFGQIIVTEGARVSIDGNFVDTNLTTARNVIGERMVIGGSGAIGDLRIFNGTLSPGRLENGTEPRSFTSRIGQLTTGDLNLVATNGATNVLAIQVNDQGQSDRVIVNGTVTLRATDLQVLDAAGGAFNSNDPFNYLIIDNDGTDAIDGTFDNIFNELAFLTPSVSYTGGDGNDVTLALVRTNMTGGGDPGCTPPAANGVTAVCRGLVSNQNDPNGYGNGENGVTLTIADGADLRGSQAGVLLGNAASVIVEEGAVVTGGFVGNGFANAMTPNAHGIRLRDGDVRVDGEIRASAMDGDGIRSDTGPVELVVGENGAIRTFGDFGNGIEVNYVQSTQDIGSILVDGLIETSGENAHGIRARYNISNAGNGGTIDVGGAIAASGAMADGIRAELANNSDVAIILTDGAEVQATNASDSGWGIYLTSYEPNTGGEADAVIDIQAGALVSSATRAAIAEGNAGGGTPTVINTQVGIAGTVQSSSASATAINLNLGDDQVTLFNGGLVEGGINLGAGDDFVRLNDGASVTGSISTGDGQDEVSFGPVALQPDDGRVIATVGSIDLGGDNDTITIRQESFNTISIDGGSGSDTLRLSSPLASTEGSVVELRFDAPNLSNIENYSSFNNGTFVLTGTDGDFRSFFARNGNYIVNGDYSGLFYNSDQSSLAGSGTLGNVIVGRGRFLRPGDVSVASNGDFVSQIGTLTTGDLQIFGSAGTAGDGTSLRMTFEVQVNDQGQSDMLDVNGTVEIGDFVNLSVLDANGGNFAGDNPFNYIIIDNDGDDAVVGTFENITNQLAFLTPTVSYDGGDGNDVALTLTRINTGGGGDPVLGCTPAAANGVTAVCRGVVTNQNDPNGFGTGVETDVTLTIAEDAVLTGSQDGVRLNERAAVVVESGARVVGEGQFGILIGSGDVTVAGNVEGVRDGVFSLARDAGTIWVQDGASVTATNVDGGAAVGAISGSNRDNTGDTLRILIEGSVEASGPDANGAGINLGAPGGTAQIDVLGGIVRATGPGADGISVTPSNDGPGLITIDDGAIVSAEGEGSSAIRLRAFDGTSFDLQLIGDSAVRGNGEGATGIVIDGRSLDTAQVATANIFIEDGSSLSAEGGPLIVEIYEQQVGQQTATGIFSPQAAGGFVTAIDTTVTLGAQIAASDADALAIDLGVGNDRLELLATYAITGVTDFGAGLDVPRQRLWHRFEVVI